MNSVIRQKAWQAGQFIIFLLHSGTRYGVHSPFLYEFVDTVIRKDGAVAGGERIEKIRKEYRQSREVIMKTDFGARAEGQESVKYSVALRHIAGSSLSTRRQARRLHRLVCFMGCTRILEIGTSLGITTAYMAAANPKSRIVTLEGCPELCRLAGENFRRLGINNIELIRGPFEETLQQALDKLGGAGLVFVDGNHRKEAAVEYFQRCLPYVNNETVMVFDDIHASPGMEDAWAQIRANPAVRISIDLFFSGWVFFRKESSREQFRLRYF